MVLLATSLLILASCEKEKAGEVRKLEKTWKITIEEPDGPEYLKAPETKMRMRPATETFYLTLSKRGVTISMSAEEAAEYFRLPEYKGHLLIVGTGVYTAEATSSTSGKISLTGLPYSFGYGGTFFTYRNLTKNSVTFVITTIYAGEITYELTAVENPKFVTEAELEALSDVRER